MLNLGGQDTFQVLESVEAVTTCGEKRTFFKDRGQLEASYRSSPFQRSTERLFITAAMFKLQVSKESWQSQLTYMRKYVKISCSDFHVHHFSFFCLLCFIERRRLTQPLLEKTAGCVFRNPTSGGKGAGQVIDELGLKGLTVGGAQVSNVHANFMVNMKRSTSKDMLALIQLVKEKVFRETGTQLQEEVLFVPYEC